MLDLERITKDPESLSRMLEDRCWESLDAENLQKLIRENKKIIGEIQEVQSRRNSLSKQVGLLLAKTKDIQQKDKKLVENKKEEVKSISQKIKDLEAQKSILLEDLNSIVEILPNWLDDNVPKGSEDNNKIIRTVGTKKDFLFPAQTHYDLGEKKGLLDFTRGVKLAGSRFYTYWGDLARLERHLIDFMLELHTKEFGYTEVFVPLLVSEEAMYTTGQFPRFRGDYYTLKSDKLSLIPTAEVPLINLYRDEIIPEKELPIALSTATSCFRREAGAAGKDTRGLVRVHQFQKVELVQFVHPEESERIHLEMLKHAEEVLIRLELTYRVVLKAAADTGSSASKSYDLEVWMPGLKRWLEISSISNCRDYQARRGQIRFKSKEKGVKHRLVHTLNGSGVAAGRCMIAIMENYQKEDGSFELPKVLSKRYK